MMPNFARKELLSLLWIKQGIVPNTLTAGNTINTYSVSPQPAAGIDSWDAGALRFRNLLLIIDVASISAGTLTVSLRDSSAAITTANGDASTAQVAAFTAISAAGLYLVEVPLDHIFPATSARVVADAAADEIEQYLSVRAVAAGGDAVFSVSCVFGRNLKSFPVQDGTALTATFSDS